MPDTKPTQEANQGLGRATSTAIKLLYGLAAVIAAGATYIAVTDNSPGAAAQPGLLWLLIANLILIAGIAAGLGARVFQLVRENRETYGGARLRLRIIFLFSLAAAIPTLIVAGFLAVAINRSVEGWFGAPVRNVVANAQAAAKSSVDDVKLDASTEVQAMMNDLNTPDYINALQVNPEAFRTELLGGIQAQFRDFTRATIMSSDGKIISDWAAPNALPLRTPSPKWFADARDGAVGGIVDKSEIIAFVHLKAYPDAFLYVSRPIPAELSRRLELIDADLRRLRDAETKRNSLAVVLTLSYLEAALLMLLGTAWLGMTAASRIAQPIGALAGAARAVRDGDLTVRMLRPQTRDEIADLADAFNEMTDRISRQTAALDRGRIDAETRSAFIETVLAGVEAGVIRVDRNLKVTIANASAQSLLGFIFRPGADLAEIAPEFVTATRRAMDTGQSADTSFKRIADANSQYFQVRVAPEHDGLGAVLTFHDTTRLVLGQRQAAWRDVARRIAHEIRNPLTPIQLSAERLRRRFSGQITQDRETFEKCTDTITRQVADIGRMVEEFSGFARMPKPTFGQFNLVDMVQSVAFAQRMATPAIAVSVNGPTDTIVTMGDERMLAQAVTNIVKNAAEAVERELEGGRMKFGVVSIDIVEDGAEVQITVRDNGPGFPAQDRERFLEPYVTTRKNGVGLGLAIVTRIVEDHGGRIWLGDNENAHQGARVDIRIPVQPKLLEEPVAYAGEGVA